MHIPFLRRRKASPEIEQQKELQNVLKELEQLKMENARLHEQLSAKEVHLGEYLYKWRAVALPLLGSEWELRYWVLDGTTLVYYRSAKDTQFSPREEINVLGCSVAWEGLRNTRHWTFSILDGGGSLLVRLSALSRSSADRWLAALQAAGCDRNDDLVPPGGPKSARDSWRPSADSMSRSLSAPNAAAIPGGRAPSPPPNGAKSSGRSAPRAGKDDDSRRSSGRTHETQGEEEEPPSPSSPAPPSAAPPMPGPRKSIGGGPHPHGGPSRGPMLGSTPVHTACRYSLLSSERAWHEKQTGLYNLALIIIVVTNFRLALENALKYGWRLNPLHVVYDIMSGGSAGFVNLWLVACYPCMLLASLLSLAIELLGHKLLENELKIQASLSKKHGLDEKEVARQLRQRTLLHEWLLFLLTLANTTSVVAMPWAVISLTKAEPISGIVMMLLTIVAWMKLVSYHHCAWDLRMARRGGEVRPGERGCPDTPTDWGRSQSKQYPENLTVLNLLYFLAAPTLVYQVNYPRSRSIRTRWLLRRLFELAITLTAMAIIIKQYIEPTMQNSLLPVRKMDFPRIVERVLKLALPNMYTWLAGFYCMFHLWLNVLAELTRFGDREFYKDWWNASTVGDYWKLWNMPVHKWLLRHVYFPAIRWGASRFWAMMLVFFVSAVFHELVMGVPLHLLRLWAFFGIMGQVPLIILTETLHKKLRRDELGNIAFWVTFCVVGQPLSLMLYYTDYIISVRPAMLAARGLAAASLLGGATGGAGAVLANATAPAMACAAGALGCAAAAAGL